MARITGSLYYLTWLSIVALPAALIWIAMSGGVTLDQVATSFPGLAVDNVPSVFRVWWVFCVGLAPLAAVMLALWHTQALFALYRDGRALSQSASAQIQKIGLALVAVAILSVVAHTLQLLILTGENAPGSRALSIRIGSSQIGFLLAGGLLVVIGRSMVEAARAVEENKTFV